jgi:hypothetical protein
MVGWTISPALHHQDHERSRLAERSVTGTANYPPDEGAGVSWSELAALTGSHSVVARQRASAPARTAGGSIVRSCVEMADRGPIFFQRRGRDGNADGCRATCRRQLRRGLHGSARRRVWTSSRRACGSTPRVPRGSVTRASGLCRARDKPLLAQGSSREGRTARAGAGPVGLTEHAEYEGLWLSSCGAGWCRPELESDVRLMFRGSPKARATGVDAERMGSRTAPSPWRG